MYKFRDIKDASVTAVMPSEALKLNGEYIENLIPGYRTLYTKGREMLSPEVGLYNTGIRDGAERHNSRFPERYITVGYQLLAESNEAFRNAFNALGGILNVSDAELIFNDELDKYFTGSLYEIGEIEPGRNQIVGEFVFVCTDPFKYSVEEYEVDPTQDDGMAFLIDYKGTYKSFPKLQADFYNESEVSDDGETETTLTGDGDCGYVAFFNEREKIIQLGDPGEEDGEDMPKSQTLIHQKFMTSGAWGTAAKKKWSANQSVVTDSSLITQAGAFGMAKMNNEDYYLTPTSFGSGSKYHGPSIARTIPADAAGDTGAKNFTFSVKHKMAIGNGKNDTKQRGAFQVMLTDENGLVIAGFNIYKSSTGKKSKLRFYANGKVLKTQEIDLSYNNKHFGHNTKKITAKKLSKIKKSGASLTFTVGCVTASYNIADIADKKVKQIHVTATKYGNYNPLKYNGVRWIKFIKNNCDTWQEVPNKFSAGDSIVADCSSGEILLNESLAPELGALGNDWEEFYLTPGVNQIGVAYSDWVDDGFQPTFKLRYREVFL
jgi:predicted phage tail component-like protein